MPNYRMSQALNDAMKSGSGMVIMTPEQVQELMTSGGSGGGYRGRGRGRGNYSSNRGYDARRGTRGGHLGRDYDNRSGNYDRQSGRHLDYHSDNRQRRQDTNPYDSRPPPRTPTQGSRYEPYHQRSRSGQWEDRRGHGSYKEQRDSHPQDSRPPHQRSYSDRPRDAAHHQRTSSRDDYPHGSSSREEHKRSPRVGRELESETKHNHSSHSSDRHNTSLRSDKDGFRDRPSRGGYRGRGMNRGRGRGTMMGVRRNMGGMFNRYDFNRYKSDKMMMTGGRVMMPNRRGYGMMGMRRGGFRGNNKFVNNRGIFNAYYFCRVCNRRYYGNREMHKFSRDHKKAYHEFLEKREKNRHGSKEKELEDFLIMDEVGDSEDEEKEEGQVDDDDDMDDHDDETEKEEEAGKSNEGDKDTKTKDGKSKDMRSALNKEVKVDMVSDPLGLRYIICVSGFFCKLCSKFYHDEHAAKTSHVKTPQHLERVVKAAKEAYNRSHQEQKKKDEKKKSESENGEKEKESESQKEEIVVKTDVVEVTDEHEVALEKTSTKTSSKEIRESTMEDDARKAGKAAASAKIAAVTAKASARRSTRRPAANLLRKTITPLRAKRLTAKVKPERELEVESDNKQEDGELVDDKMDAVDADTDDVNLELDESALDRAAPKLIPGLDMVSSMDD